MRHLLGLILLPSTLLAADVDPATQSMLEASVRMAVLRDLGRGATSLPGGTRQTVLAVAQQGGDTWYRVSLDLGAEAPIKPCYDVRIGKDPFGGTSVLEARLNLQETGQQLVAAQKADPEADARARIASTLKSGIHPAQVVYQSGAYEDRNDNGIGDFASEFAVLDGTRPMHGKTLTLLPADFVASLEKGGARHVLLADHERQFWCFVVLPSGAETLAIDASGQVRTLAGAVLPTTGAEAEAAIAKAKPYRR